MYTCGDNYEQGITTDVQCRRFSYTTLHVAEGASAYLSVQHTHTYGTYEIKQLPKTTTIAIITKQKSAQNNSQQRQQQHQMRQFYRYWKHHHLKTL